MIGEGDAVALVGIAGDTEPTLVVHPMVPTAEARLSHEPELLAVA